MPTPLPRPSRPGSKTAKRIAGLIQQLQDPSAEKRLQAIVGLQERGEAAIGPLIAVLADPARAAEHANVRAALAEMGRAALPPLVAIVEQADPKMAVQAIEVLGDMNDARVAFCLLRPALSDKSDPAVREAAAAALKKLGVTFPAEPRPSSCLSEDAKDYFERLADVEGPAERKRRRCGDGTRPAAVRGRVCTRNDVARAFVAQRARDAYAMAPDDPSARLLYLATMLEQAAYENGLDRPLDAKNPAAVEAAFGVEDDRGSADICDGRQSSGGGSSGGATVGQIGTAAELLYRGAGPSPLALAVQSPDRRLRMAALEAIVRLQPARPFAGSSYVLPALGFFAGSSGFRHALVAAPSLMERGSWRACSSGPASSPTRSPTARNWCWRPRNRPTTSWR